MGYLLIMCSLLIGSYISFILFGSYSFAFIPKRSKAEPYTPSVSVIIPARNEETHILSCLSSVLTQQYKGSYEVILVDDHSTDETLNRAQSLLSEYHHLRILNANEVGKKAALAQAILHAKGEVILQTDADCRVGPEWLRSMVQCLHQTPNGFVSGPIALDYQGVLFQPLQALESMGLVAFGAGFLSAGRPNMSNGANMAYGKQVFMDLNGYEGIDHVASGDDELLLQKIHLAGKYPLAFCKDARAIVRTDAVASWKEFKAQRIRWLSKARAYLDKGPNIIQVISYISFWTFPVLLLMSFWNHNYLYFCGALFLCKALVDLTLMYQAARFFHNLRLLRWFIPLEILYIPYVIWIGLAGLFAKTYTWKGRTVS